MTIDPTPEMLRLQQALQIDQAAYGVWIDEHQQDVALLIATTPLEEDISAVLHAGYIHHNWGSSK